MGKKITARTPEELLEMSKKGHEVKRYGFFDEDVLCSEICVDFTTHEVASKNLVSDLTRTAFGVNQAPSWSDWEAFLEERCVPRSRVGIQRYLSALGLLVYDPFAIVQKTQGRMAEDQQWIGEI